MSAPIRKSNVAGRIEIGTTMTATQAFIYINGADVELRITVEPWADQYLIHPGQEVKILVHSEDTVGMVELLQLSTGLTIFGYTGCIISLLSGGSELSPVAQ